MSAESARNHVSGWVLTSLFAAGTLARHARMLRLRGRTFVARVVRHPDVALDLEPLADRLAGVAHVRFWGALDCAIRFREGEIVLARSMDHGEYHAVSPFDAGLVHALHFRLGAERDDAFELDVGASPYGPWSPLARVELLHAAPGIVDTLRRGAVTMSDWVRPRTVP